MRRDVTPLPAIAAGKGPFRVKGMPSGSGGACAAPDKEPGSFEVPLESGSLQALAVRIHELGHLGLLRMGALPSGLLSALKRARIHFGWVQFSLDVVVNSFMLARGNPEISRLQLWSGLPPPDIPRWMAAMEFLRCEGLSRELNMRMSLQGRAHFITQELELLCSTAQLLRNCGSQAGNVGTTCKPLLSIKEMRALLLPLQKTFGPKSMQAGHSLVDSGYLEASGGKPDSSSDPGVNQWGKMEIIEPPLVLHSGKPDKMAKKLIAGFSGPFRFPHRAVPAADGRAFGLKKRNHGGTILIDCSGSMNISIDQLRSLVSRSAAPTVAVYAGLPDNDSGSLAIVSKGGRFADMEEVASHFGKGNLVDGPALRWLSRQAAPRLWISDGHVTGRGDTSAANLEAEAGRIQKAARIRRIESFEACARRLGAAGNWR